ncbi:MAG: 1,4-dihydroxy-2-naphthoate octaprenyltransferase, partial [Ilumatobacter sp.]
AQRTRWLYVVLIAAAFVLVAVAATTDRPSALIGLAAVPLAIVPTRAVLGGANGQALIGVLGATGKLQLGFGVAVTFGLALGG